MKAPNINTCIANSSFRFNTNFFGVKLQYKHNDVSNSRSKVYSNNYFQSPESFELSDSLYESDRAELEETFEPNFFRDEELFDRNLDVDKRGYMIYDQNDVVPSNSVFHSPILEDYYTAKGSQFSENKSFVADTDISPRNIDSPAVDINYCPDVDIYEKYPALLKTDFEIPVEKVKKASELKIYGKKVPSDQAKNLMISKLCKGHDFNTVRQIKEASVLQDLYGNERINLTMFNDAFDVIENRDVDPRIAINMLNASVFKDQMGQDFYEQNMFNLINNLNKKLPINDSIKYALKAKGTADLGNNFFDINKANLILKVVSKISE